MPRGGGWVLLVLLGASLIPACRYDTVELPGEPSSTTGTPTATPSPTATGTPYGDGHDGPLTVSPLNDFQVTGCAPLTLAGDSTISMPSVSGFAVGRLVVVLQMQGTFAMSGDGAAISPGTIGSWELRRVTEVDTPGDVLTVDTAFSGTYETSLVPPLEVAQVCTVPEYTTVTVESLGHVVAAPWNGASGGVIAFAVSQALEIQANGVIDATGAGFRGGIPSTFGVTANVALNDTVTDGEGAGKGEGMDARSWMRFGRGNYANAGGGGNSVHSGGGGGGNGGEGGLGGKQLEVDGDTFVTRGFGGAPLAMAAASRLTAGGGGGGGQNDGGAEADGGRGGGIVLMLVANLSGAGRIESDGIPGEEGNEDGAGGGGAGGTILVVTSSSSFTGELFARGGRGGDQFYPYVPVGMGDFGHGAPGGGGGGGRIAAPMVVASGATVSVSAGQNGVVVDDGDAWGATAGDVGVVE